MMRTCFVVTHLLGTGHLSRVLTLARAFLAEGMAVRVISGGRAAPQLMRNVPQGIDFVQLPSVASDGTDFSTLLDEHGMPVNETYMTKRQDYLLKMIQDFAPNILITELFPFGRRMLRAEFLNALDGLNNLTERPVVLASIRDILAPPSNEKKQRHTEEWLSEHYDGILVHSDKDIVPLKASWPVSQTISEKLHYTGFVGAEAVPVDPNGDGAGEILVSAGGGDVGRALFEAATEASHLSDRRWRLLVGGRDVEPLCQQLMSTGRNVIAEPARPDFRNMLGRCDVAVGQCGYNTALDWLQAGVRGVFVPFAEGGEVEQSLRANLLAKRFGYGLVTEDDLNAETLMAAVHNVIDQMPAHGARLSFNGARISARLAKSIWEERT